MRGALLFAATTCFSFAVLNLERFFFSEGLFISLFSGLYSLAMGVWIVFIYRELGGSNG